MILLLQGSRRRPTAGRAFTTPFVLVLAIILLGPASLVVTGAEEGVVVPVARGLGLDGRLDEPAWKDAARVEAAAVTLPFPPADGEALGPDLREVEPDVRVLVQGGELWIGVRLAEPPGLGMGLAAMLAAEGTESAADALAFHYLPQHVGAATYVARGPRGVGRATYRVQGAAWVEGREAWSVEVRLPLVDLGLGPADLPLRLAVAVRTRDPGLVAWAPAGAAFRGPSTWARLLPPEGGWPRALPTIREDLAAEDGRDDERLGLWRLYEAASQRSVENMVQEAGFSGVLEGGPTRRQLLEAVRQPLLRPLERMAEIRPDLAYLHVLRGDVLGKLGLLADATLAYLDALKVVPYLREAGVGAWVWGFGAAFAEGEVDGPTQYDQRFDGLTEAMRVGKGGFVADGARLARGLLHYKRGDFQDALESLRPLAARYPFSQRIVFVTERCRKAVESWPKERQYRAAETQADTLPRVRFVTARGDLVVELFEDDAPNTVKNFVWLAQHGFYDGTRVSSTVPLFRVLAGDARSREESEPTRDPGPGYAIATEKPSRRDGRVRRPFRGTLLMAAAEEDSEGSLFFLTTGTSLHLEGDFVVFGRVLEGQDVLESMEGGDLVQGVEVVRTRPDVEYRPLTVDGKPAPEPR